MNIYFLADCHIDCKGGNLLWLNDCVSYFDNIFIPFCKEHVKSNDILCILGDWFDNRSQVTIPSIYHSVRLFEQFSDIFSKIILIVGNHDMFKKNDNNMTSLNMLKNISNVEIIYKPEVRKISEKKILFVPWIEDVKEQKELLKSHNVDYVFGHLEIGGCVTNSRKGIVLNTNNSIQSTDFKKAQVYAGHIHIRQDYKNVHYVGTPYHKDRGDIGNTKGFTILNLESGRSKFVENKYSPKFIRDSIYDLLDSTIGDLKTRWGNNYVDLVVKNSDIPDCNFNEMRDLLNGHYKEFNIVCDNSEQSLLKDENIQLSETKSVKDNIDEYIEQLEISDDVKNDINNILTEYMKNNE